MIFSVKGSQNQLFFFFFFFIKSFMESAEQLDTSLYINLDFEHFLFDHFVYFFKAKFQSSLLECFWGGAC